MLVLLPALVAPAFSFADTGSNPPLTRAQVRHERVELESVGYDPSRDDDVSYPNDLLNAEQQLAEKHQKAKRQGVSALTVAN